MKNNQINYILVKVIYEFEVLKVNYFKIYFSVKINN